MRCALSILLALTAATACGKNADQPDPDRTTPGSGSAGSGAATPPGAGGLVIAIDGVPQPAARGFVKRRPDGSLQAYVGEGGTCDQLLTNVFDSKHESILIDLPSRLAPDGTETHTVELVYLAGGSDATPDGPATATVTGTADAGTPVELAIEFVGPEDSGKLVTIKGAMTLEACGDQDVSKETFTKARHPSNALLTVATRKFPVMAALRRGATIELFDFPRDCVAARYLGVKLTYDGATWRLSGKRFASEIAGEAKGLSIKPGAAGTSDDGPTVLLDLAGTDKLGDYAIALDGTVEAIDCK